MKVQHNREYERLRGTRGFTLVELLTVIAIIGILTTVVTVNVSSSRRQARDARRKTDLKTIQTAVELYTNAKGIPPEALAWKESKGDAGSQWIPDLDNYLSSVPRDPINDTVYFYRYRTGDDAAGYRASYVIEGTLEEKGDGNLNPSNFSQEDNTNPDFFKTGTWKDESDKLHQRFSSGAGQ